MLKIKLKVNYRSSKLKVCLIMGSVLLLGILLFFTMTLFSKWKANEVEELEIVLNTEDALYLKGSIYIKMLNGAPLPVKVDKVFCFFLVKRKTNRGEAKPEVFASVFATLDKLVSPGRKAVCSSCGANSLVSFCKTCSMPCRTNSVSLSLRTLA